MFIENIIYFILGLLVSSLLGFFIMPSIWKRAVRLTKKRYESANPISMAEFKADKDQLRAQFALSTRKLEVRIEKLRTTLSEQLVELNENKSELSLMDVEQDKQNIHIKELETRVVSTKERILELEKKNADISSRLRMKELELENGTDNKRDHILELEKKTIGLSHKLRMKEREIENLRSSLDKQINKNRLKISPKIAEAQITKANDKLEALVHKSDDKNDKRSLAQDLLYEENVEHLHKKITKIEKSIISKWQNNSAIKKADLNILRNELEEVATMVSSLLYAKDSDNTTKVGESLLEKVQKFAITNKSEQQKKSNKKQDPSSITKRLKPVFDHTRH